MDEWMLSCRTVFESILTGRKTVPKFFLTGWNMESGIIWKQSLLVGMGQW